MLDINLFEKFMEELRVLPRVVIKESKIAKDNSMLDINLFEKFMEELRVLPRVVIKESKIAGIIKEQKDKALEDCMKASKAE